MGDVIHINLYGDIVEYKCPNCGEINKLHKSTVEILKENGKTYIFCENIDCDNKIKL